MDVLVVDDDESASGTIVDVLQSGVSPSLDGTMFACETTLSCELALELVIRRESNSKPFDCIVLDWLLKEGPASGYIPLLRAKAPFTGIVVVTGYEEIDYAMQSFRCGADAFVSKVQLVKHLPRSINEVVEFRRRRFAEVQTFGQRLHRLQQISSEVTKGIREIKALQLKGNE